MRQSRELLAGDRLGSLATREKRTRPTTREREDLEEARARLHNPRSQEDLVARGTQLSEHVRLLLVEGRVETPFPYLSAK